MVRGFACPQAESDSPSGVSGIHYRRIVVSKAPKIMLMPAVWAIAIAVASIGMIVANSSHFRAQNVSGANDLASRAKDTQEKQHPVAANSPAPALGAEQRGRVYASFDTLPLAFEANQGQTDPQVKYMARGNGYTVFLTGNETVFALSSSAQSASRARVAGKHISGKYGVGATSVPVENKPEKETAAAIHMKLVGGNPRSEVVAAKELPGRSNYFIGNDPSKWQKGVKQYAAVSYHDVYPGVDLAFHGQQRQLEFDFIVAAGASTAPIRFDVTGATQITTDASGNLVLSSAAGDVLLHKPVAYQEKNNSRQPVDARFAVQANNTVSFELGSYDRRQELIIDPSVSYATYLGGLAEDDGYAIAVDSNGNAYVTGETKSTNFPTVAGAYSASLAGGFDVFVTKIAPGGASLIYSTYVGGSSDDSGNAIAVDASGDAFVAGGTASSSDFPTTIGAYQTTFGGGSLDAFVFELSSSGGSLTYSTYLGGSGTDLAEGLALDASGNAYIVGSTYSTNFPTHGAIQGSINGGSNGFVTKLNSSGNALVYSTYLGGGTGDIAIAVAADSSGNAYVTGATQNSTFPTTAGAFQKTCGTAANCNGGLSDAFVSVINASGSAFVYSTFLGGSNADQGLGIAVDAAGDAYVTGQTQSNTDFPTKSAIQATFGGGTQDAFVTELNPAGSALVYSTYLGGSGNDSGAAIAVDSGMNAYVTGQTASTNFPTASPTQSANKGENDAFVTEISAGGTALVFSTYLGGSLNEDTSTSLGGSAVGAIAVDSDGAYIYVTGNTASTDFPTQSPDQLNNGGGTDAFVAKYAQTNFGIAATTPAPVNPGVSGTSTVTLSSINGFSSPVNLTCSVAGTGSSLPTCSAASFSTNPVTPVSGGTNTTLTIATTTSTPGGTYTVTVTGTSGGFVHSTTVSLTVNVPDFSVAASTPAAVNPGSSGTSTVTLTSSNGYNLPVTLSCSVAGTGSPLPSCSASGAFSTNPVTPTSAGATSTLTMTTTAPASTHTQHASILPALWLPLAGLSLVGMCFLSAAQRRKAVGVMSLMLLVGSLALLPSCGGSSNTGGNMCSAVPSVPTGLAASSTTSTGTTLTWTASIAGANCTVTSYTIYQNGTQIGTSSAPTFNVTGLTGSTTYNFTVSATDSAGASAQSSALGVTTGTAGTPAGSYTVTITGTDANKLSHSTQVTLTVN